jgi:hypothetical protein
MIFLPMNKRGLRKNQPYALDRLVESALDFFQQKEGAAQDACHLPSCRNPPHKAPATASETCKPVLLPLSLQGRVRKR